jgi:prepilin-type N-terminal cleavage/methylation domain-containing protein
MLANLYKKTGFTLIELMVVIAIIGILSTILYASFDVAKAQSRDKVRTASLKEVQLAIELYKAQNGVYPTRGCSSASAASDFVGPGPVPGGSGGGFYSCAVYINGLTPDFIPSLPTDPSFENEAGRGFYYQSNGISYKLMLLDVAESIEVEAYDEKYARCPAVDVTNCPDIATIATTYAVYSTGAEDW